MWELFALVKFSLVRFGTAIFYFPPVKKINRCQALIFVC